MKTFFVYSITDVFGKINTFTYFFMIREIPVVPEDKAFAGTTDGCRVSWMTF